MPTPFPGMDPYLEHHSLWSDVHNRLIVDLRIDHRAAPEPPLEEEDAGWVDDLLRQAALR